MRLLVALFVFLLVLWAWGGGKAVAPRLSISDLLSYTRLVDDSACLSAASPRRNLARTRTRHTIPMSQTCTLRIHTKVGKQRGRGGMRAVRAMIIDAGSSCGEGEVLVVLLYICWLGSRAERLWDVCLSVLLLAVRAYLMYMFSRYTRLSLRQIHPRTFPSMQAFPAPRDGHLHSLCRTFNRHPPPSPRHHLPPPPHPRDRSTTAQTPPRRAATCRNCPAATRN